MQSTAPLGGEDATVSGMTTRRDEARRQRRAAIVRAALARFADQGYDATTVAEVAQAAGVAPRTVSLHFPTKLDLALAYGTDAARRLAELVAARPAGTSVVDACGTWARRELAEHGEELAGHRAMLAANPGLRGTQTDDGAAARAQVSAAVAAELGRDPGDPSIRFLTGAVDGVLDALLEQPPGPGDDPQAAVDAAVALLRSIVVGGAPRPAPRPVAAVERNQPVPPPAVVAVDGNEPGGSTTEPMSAPPVLTERRLLTHLERLEAESIHIIREAVAESERPVMLYSIGKDSGVMLHLARKAFAPAPPPFPLLHVDTTWKFRAMYELRDRMAEEAGMELLVWQNPEAVRLGINPFDHGSALHTDVWKTEGLKQALDHWGFDCAFGGARRDEEKSRAKERVFSIRSPQHRWDPKQQRPELWRLYNARRAKGESIRVFPLSNWTELDVWLYIHREGIPIVPLYLAAERPVVERDGTLLMVDDDRFPLQPGEEPELRSVRFRTLGCYPLTGAVESRAATLPEVIQETLLTTTSERQGRVIDHDSSGSMERKKQEGYF